MIPDKLVPRPNAGPGYWLSFLIPFAVATSFEHAKKHGLACAALDYQLNEVLTGAAWGMGLETLCYFLCEWLKEDSITKTIITLLPMTFTSLYLNLQMAPGAAVLFSLVLGILYLRVYKCVLSRLPRTFSYGEASILVQGLFLFVVTVGFRLLRGSSRAMTDFDKLYVIMQSALCFLLIACALLTLYPSLRRTVPLYILLTLLLVAVTCAPVTQPMPLIVLLDFILKDQKRLYIIAFYLVLVALTCATVSWQLRHSTKANTRVRKIFHLLIVLVFVPGICYQCQLLYMATGIAFAVFVVLEIIRLLKLPPFAAQLALAFNSFKDEKDAGPLALTPFCLLIGCCLPIWLTSCPCSVAAHDSPLVLLSGILAVGIGDAAASVVGSKMGRTKWSRNTDRSVEGTFAFIFSILLSVGLLQLCGLLPMSHVKWFCTVIAAINTALVESITDQIDNLVLPLVFYIFVGYA